MKHFVQESPDHPARGFATVENGPFAFVVFTWRSDIPGYEPGRWLTASMVVTDGHVRPPEKIGIWMAFSNS